MSFKMITSIVMIPELLHIITNTVFALDSVGFLLQSLPMHSIYSYPIFFSQPATAS